MINKETGIKLILILSAALLSGCVEDLQCNEHNITAKWSEYPVELAGVGVCATSPYTIVKTKASMYPTIKCNEPIYGINTTTHPAALEALSVCDIIIFRTKPPKEGHAAHRIIKKGTDDQGIFYVTQGDNNPGTDLQRWGKVRPEDIDFIVVV